MSPPGKTQQEINKAIIKENRKMLPKRKREPCRISPRSKGARAARVRQRMLISYLGLGLSTSMTNRVFRKDDDGSYVYFGYRHTAYLLVKTLAAHPVYGKVYQPDKEDNWAYLEWLVFPNADDDPCDDIWIATGYTPLKRSMCEEVIIEGCVLNAPMPAGLDISKFGRDWAGLD